MTEISKNTQDCLRVARQAVRAHLAKAHSSWIAEELESYQGDEKLVSDTPQLAANRAESGIHGALRAYEKFLALFHGWIEE